MQIKKLRQIDIFFLIVLIAYAFDFGNLKYALAWLFVVAYFVCAKMYKKLEIGGIRKEYFLILSGIIFLFGITIVKQLINGFNSYAINEAVYYFTPLFFVIVYTQLSDNFRMENIFYYLFALYVVVFLKNFAGQLTLANIKSISFTDSYSPFESEMAFVFLIYECFFIHQQKKKYAVISLFLCILSFKRICMLVAIIVFVFQKYVGQRKQVGKKWVILAVALFVLLPVGTCIMIDNTFETWFYSTFHVTLDEITLSRSSRIEAAIRSGQIKYGLGSVTTYLTKYLNTMHGSNFSSRSMHNDLVQIYLECGMFGSVVFTYVYMKAASVSKTSFALMCYIFFECYFNHLFGAGCTHIWILIYLMIYITGTVSSKEERKKR